VRASTTRHCEAKASEATPFLQNGCGDEAIHASQLALQLLHFSARLPARSWIATSSLRSSLQ
jgi:hypothetical protein